MFSDFFSRWPQSKDKLPSFWKRWCARFTVLSNGDIPKYRALKPKINRLRKSFIRRRVCKVDVTQGTNISGNSGIQHRDEISVLFSNGEYNEQLNKTVEQRQSSESSGSRGWYGFIYYLNDEDEATTEQSETNPQAATEAARNEQSSNTTRQ